MKQCILSISEFCTPWPGGLKDPKEIDKHYPIEVMTSDYCHSSPSIRDPRARIVTLRVSYPYIVLYLNHTYKFNIEKSTVNQFRPTS